MSPVLSDFRACFPVAEHWIYFNHAAVCPMALPVARAIEAFLTDATANGSTGFRQWDQTRASARARAARLLGCRAEDIALTTSTSQGLIAVAEGLPLGPGDEVLIVQDDFPANQIPWYRQERRGVRVISVPRDARGRVSAEAVLERVGPSTRVLALPYVLYDSGFRLDLAAIGAGLGDHPALFCVDAIQGLGALPLDVEACHIDVASADSHKWILGTEGIGLLYVRSERLSQIDSPLTSWLSLARPFERWTPGAPLRDDARRHEFASLPTALVHGLDAALGMLLETGVEAIERQVLALTEALAAGLMERGWSLLGPRDRPAECSGIVAGSPPRGTPEELVARLESRGVSVVSRGGAVRFSPHGWNTLDEVHSLLDRLD